MPRQNRVTPAGEIIATSARGLLMGNRGCLHNDQGQPYLVLEDRLRSWQPEGYGPAVTRPDFQTVRVLTPRSVVRMLAQGGYRPDIFPSAFFSRDDTG